MSAAHALGSVLVGYDAVVVRLTVDADASRLGAVEIRGLPDAAARETRIRVRSALASEPITSRACEGVRAIVTVHDLPERILSASSLDLAIAVAVARACGVPTSLGVDTVFVGDLALDGRLRPVRGAFRHSVACRDRRSPIVGPAENAWELGLVPHVDGYASRRLGDAFDGTQLRSSRIETTEIAPYTPRGRSDLPISHRPLLDACLARRGTLLVGQLGSGKTMLARRVATAATALGYEEGLEVAGIQGVSGILGSAPLSACRPFRAPHHTVSTAGLVGDGRHPGEVSLAHRGVLFLDEVTELRRESVETLARVLREGIARFRDRGFPASPTYVIAAANPCPCGYYAEGHDCGSCNGRRCACSSEARERHVRRLSDIARALDLERVEVPPFDVSELAREGRP